jgi:hypothetical protein
LINSHDDGLDMLVAPLRAELNAEPRPEP